MSGNSDQPLNPYAPPAGDEVPEPADDTQRPGKRSSVPMVFGVLSIVFGATCACFFGLALGCGYIAATKFKSMAQEHKAAARAARGESPEPVSGSDPAEETASRGLTAGPIFVGVAYFVVMPLALLGAGIGQVRYRRWARRASLGWSILAVLMALGFAGLGLSNEGRDGLVGMIIFCGLFLPYPLLLLFFFTRKRVVASMQR